MTPYSVLSAQCGYQDLQRALFFCVFGGGGGWRTIEKGVMGLVGEDSWGGGGREKELRSRGELFVNYLFGPTVRVFCSSSFSHLCSLF